MLRIKINLNLIPKTVQKSDALIRAVKLIYVSVEETVLDRELRGKVIRELDEHVKILGNVMDHKLNLLKNPIILQSRPNKTVNTHTWLNSQVFWRIRKHTVLNKRYHWS